MANTDFDVTITGVLRTLTTNLNFQYTVNTGTLSTDCDNVGTAVRYLVTHNSLTAKSVHGHCSFAAVAGRTLGGQTTYRTVYDTATPTELRKAEANTVEPEHRISFALNEVDLASAGAVSSALQGIIKQGHYEYALYKH